MAEGSNSPEMTPSGLPQGRFAEMRKQYEPIREEVNAVVDKRKEMGWSNRDLHTTRHIAAESAHAVHEKTQEQIKNLEEIANKDGLTRVLNRRAIDETIQARINQNRRNGTDFLRQERRQSGTNDVLALIDINDFKQKNDGYGHAVGDEVLKGVANALEVNLRATDDVGRYGGDEFMVLLRDVHSETEAVQKLDKIRQTIEQSNYANTHTTVTIGVSTIAPHFRDLKEAVEAADANLYGAKEAGKNKVFGNQEMQKWRSRPLVPELTHANA